MILENDLPHFYRNLLQEGEHAISIFETSSFRRIYYLISNLRIIKCTNKRNIQSYHYSSIYKIEVRYDVISHKILLHTQPMRDSSERGTEDLNHIIVLGNIRDPYKAKKIIEKAWFEESPFGRRKKPFEQLAQKYGLSFTPIVLKGNGIIQMNGSINGMNVLFYIDNVYRFGPMHMSVACPNPENNHLSIEREKPSDGIRKLFGKQDIITNSPAFDKRFLLQSDHQRFFDFVIRDDVRNKLMKASSFIEGSIFFGLKKKKKKFKKKNTATEFNILDEHLLEELLPETKLDDSLFSPLVFQCDNIRKNLFNVDIMIAHSLATFEVMLEIANRIKEYSEK